MTAPEPTFAGEVQFRRWSDSSTQGVQVTFALHDSESLEPLKHKAGKRFMAVLVEIGDHELPVEPSGYAALGPLCKEAIDLCKDQRFIEWMQSMGWTDPAKGIQHVCGVSSRKELDKDPKAADLFVKRIRVGFMRTGR